MGQRGARVVVAAIAAAFACIATASAGDVIGPKSGLPVPRFVSLKPDRVNVRGGPTRDHDVTFVYTRAGLPVEITAESDNWRRIRDWEGSEGWVYHSLLSGRRTAVVAPKDKEELVSLYDKADLGARSPPACSRACRPPSSGATAAGARSPAPASTAGSCRSSSGASTRTRRWSDQ